MSERPISRSANTYVGIKLEENMSISPGRRVGGVAIEIPGAAQILEKLGIDYCCGGDRSIEDACLAADVSVQEVLRRLEAAEESKPAAAEFVDWSRASLSQLVSHIIDKHHIFTCNELERLVGLISRVCAAHGRNHPELLSIQELFNDLKDELLPHMKKEEGVLFPYIFELEAAVTAERLLPKPFFGTVSNPIRVMMVEHERAGDTIEKIRSLSANFSVPADGCASYRALYEALEFLEADLHLHIHLENNILFPAAIKMES